jgi:LuxR family glucitol operon transcriptional activator
VPDANLVRMSRARLFALITSFEQDMRAIVEKYLIGLVAEEVLLGNDYEEMRLRRARDHNEDEVSLVHYLDLRPCFDILLRNRGELAHELAEEISANAPLVQEVVPVRNRVMHGRPLKPEDPDSALTSLQMFTTRHWPSVQQTLGRLRKDAAWEPAFEKLTLSNEKVLHNLPEPDYDDTGFVGRKEESKRLLDALVRGRDNVITITGEGGIGKTTIALDVAYRLIDHDQNPFDAILWVSLKTEKLTAYGVEELSDAIRGIDETIVALGRGISDDFRGRVQDLAESLDGISCLVIIDNLESAQGTEVIELYETLPDSVKYLFTSRLGIGELERRFPLPSLKEEEAKQLFRKFASRRGQAQLAGLSDEALGQVVERLRHSPLAIRWYVLSVEVGKPPVDTLRSQQELLEFCVQNVFEALTPGSRAVLSILGALDRSIGFDEFAVLTDMSIDDLRAATQELTRGSLVVVEAESAGTLSGKLALTATARAFLPRPDRSGTFIAEVLRRERQYKATIEQRAAQQLRVMDSRIVRARDASDHPAMHLLETALTAARSSQFARARGYVDRARAFNPEFSEVHRIAGEIDYMEGRYESAVSNYQNALNFAIDPLPISITSYTLASVMSGKLHEAGLALPHAERAYELWQNSDTAFQTGRLRIWNGRYHDGQELLEEALETSTGRHHMIVRTALVDSWYRWAEHDFKNHQYADALQKASAGLHSGFRLDGSKHGDVKSTEALADCCTIFIKTVMAIPGESAVQENQLQKICAFVENRAKLLNSSRKLTYIREAIRSQTRDRTVSPITREQLTRALSLLSNSTIQRR